MSARFVAREAELDLLCGLCESVRAGGRPAAAVVHGDPGTGKTRLLQEVRSRVDLDELAIGGFEPEQTVPLAAAGPLLRRLASIRVDPTAHVVDSRAALVEPIEPLGVFESVNRVIARLGPTLFVIDDLQWVDPTSIALVHYVFRAAVTEQRAIALLIATRSSPSSRSFAESLRRLSLDAPPFAEIELGPLDQEAGVRLARELAPDLDDEEAIRIWHRSQGFPFWLEVLADNRDSEPVVGEVVARRLRTAGPDASLLLAHLAVAGRPLLAEDVATVTGWSPTRSRHAAAELVGRGLAVQSGDSLHVAHDLIRESAARDLPTEEAIRIHARLAEWLEQRSGGDEQLLLQAMGHRREAGLPVLDLAIRLARSTRRRLLGSTGLRLLATIADEARGGADRIELLGNVAALAVELGEDEVALEWWAEIAGTSGDPGMVARAALSASECATRLGRSRDARAFLERARKAAPRDRLFSISLDAQEASVLRRLEHRPLAAWNASIRAVEAARSAIAQAGGIGGSDDALRAAYLRALAVGSDAALLADDPSEMSSLSREWSAIAADRDPASHVQSLLNTGMAQRLLGRNDDAEATLRRAWDQAHRLVLPLTILDVGTTFGAVLLSLGRLDEAEAIVEECLALRSRLAEFGPARAFAAILRPLLDMSHRAWRPAADALRLAAERETDPHVRVLAHLERASCLARLSPRHDAGVVRSTVPAALSDARASGCRRCLAEVAARGAEALARVGDVGEARALLDDPHTRPGDSDLLNDWFRRRAEAILVLAEGSRQEAIGKLESVIEAAETYGMPLEAMRARHDLGVALAPTDRRRAAEQLRLAGKAAERMAARTEAWAAERALRGLGVRTWRRGRAAPDVGVLGSLTAREREIAHLVAAGATNPEIAAELFLSRKTVERHVSNALAKLGLRNRAELAAFMGGQPASPSRT